MRILGNWRYYINLFRITQPISHRAGVQTQKGASEPRLHGSVVFNVRKWRTPTVSGDLFSTCIESLSVSKSIILNFQTLGKDHEM